MENLLKNAGERRGTCVRMEYFADNADSRVSEWRITPKTRFADTNLGSFERFEGFKPAADETMAVGC